MCVCAPVRPLAVRDRRCMRFWTSCPSQWALLEPYPSSGCGGWPSCWYAAADVSAGRRIYPLIDDVSTASFLQFRFRTVTPAIAQDRADVDSEASECVGSASQVVLNSASYCFLLHVFYATLLSGMESMVRPGFGNTPRFIQAILPQRAPQ